MRSASGSPGIGNVRNGNARNRPAPRAECLRCNGRNTTYGEKTGRAPASATASLLRVYATTTTEQEAEFKQFDPHPSDGSGNSQTHRLQVPERWSAAARSTILPLPSVSG